MVDGMIAILGRIDFAFDCQQKSTTYPFAYHLAHPDSWLWYDFDAFPRRPDFAGCSWKLKYASFYRMRNCFRWDLFSKLFSLFSFFLSFHVIASCLFCRQQNLTVSIDVIAQHMLHSRMTTYVFTILVFEYRKVLFDKIKIKKRETFVPTFHWALRRIIFPLLLSLLHRYIYWLNSPFASAWPIQ